jgi:hypothetical protein
MICVYFLLPSRGGAIIAPGEHSFPSDPRRACRLFRRPARQAAIRCPNQSATAAVILIALSHGSCDADDQTSLLNSGSRGTSMASVKQPSTFSSLLFPSTKLAKAPAEREPSLPGGRSPPHHPIAAERARPSR